VVSFIKSVDESGIDFSPVTFSTTATAACLLHITRVCSSHIVSCRRKLTLSVVAAVAFSSVTVEPV